MQRLTGVIKNYPWGSEDEIPKILGTVPDGRPQAEYWLGTHPGGPSTLDGTEGATLDHWLAENSHAMGRQPTKTGVGLPFLLKILAAAQPLSLQAHPNRTQAEDGFAAEDAAGIPLDAPNRSFKDKYPKPEMLVALSPFDALVGFREPQATYNLYAGLGANQDVLRPILNPLQLRDGSSALAQVFLECLSTDGSGQEMLNEVLTSALRCAQQDDEVGRFARLALTLDEFYPGEISILAALLLNQVSLRPGEAIFTPPGTLHAYLKGVGIEIMASSDNVLRGGLTSKYINVSALTEVVRFETCDVRPEAATKPGGGVFRYTEPAGEFDLWRIDPPQDALVELPATERPRILLVIEGHLHCDARKSNPQELVAGQAAFIEAGETVRTSGDALAFLGAPGQ